MEEIRTVMIANNADEIDVIDYTKNTLFHDFYQEYS